MSLRTVMSKGCNCLSSTDLHPMFNAWSLRIKRRKCWRRSGRGLTKHSSDSRCAWCSCETGEPVLMTLSFQLTGQRSIQIVVDQALEPFALFRPSVVHSHNGEWITVGPYLVTDILHVNRFARIGQARRGYVSTYRPRSTRE